MLGTLRFGLERSTQLEMTTGTLLAPSVPGMEGTRSKFLRMSYTLTLGNRLCTMIPFSNVDCYSVTVLQVYDYDFY